VSSVYSLSAAEKLSGAKLKGGTQDDVDSDRSGPVRSSPLACFPTATPACFRRIADPITEEEYATLDLNGDEIEAARVDGPLKRAE